MARVRIELRVEGLPPKKDGANSMWNKGTEVPRLKALRRAVLEALAGAPPLARDISLNLEVHVGALNTRHTGDLDNFITGICDGLMAAHPRATLHEAWTKESKIHPAKTLAIEDDSQVLAISARKVIADEDPWYRLEIEGM